ncbi:MAG: plasma-membrane proton-efflux P-type ATPase [Elusimicrobia bacterium]|nr:plasma-membrane proton-efflux P-type ATPase [Elusimicrobiota bacterium]
MPGIGAARPPAERWARDERTDAGGRVTSDEGVPASRPAPGRGLSGAEAARRLAQYGPNAVAPDESRPWRALLAKFWAPVPWMLEAAIVLQLLLGKAEEASVVAALLIVNAGLSFAQESRANRALGLLRGRLAVRARALRDGRWRQLAAAELVPGDVIRIRAGDLAPADLRLADGGVLLDQSALTGESLPVEAGAGAAVYAGSVVQRGEADCEVEATGGRTYFGRTAELVRGAGAESRLETLILTIVKRLVALDVVLVAALLLYAALSGMSFSRALPFALILLVASVPAALPATFTLATALGAQELARRGVLVTRLSAIEEAAAMDVLASDKTGTITENRLAVAALKPFPPSDEDGLLRLAALASDEASQDPIDLAILAAARARGLLEGLPRRLKFLPFDPALKRSEAAFEEGGASKRAVKGAPRVVASLADGAPDAAAETERLASEGRRVLAVAGGAEGSLRLAGLLAFEDPTRPDSAALVRELGELGVRVVMVTGDGLATARAVAAQVGIGGRACGREALDEGGGGPPEDCGVYARVYPEDKFRLVRSMQRAGRVTGMTGDGVNDAPALRQAEVGIAVANAADVAKAAVGMVLTNPGLKDVVAAVETSRRIYQRMLTYTLNKIIKTLEIGVFLSLGVMLTGAFVITPRLMVLLLFANDFVTMSIATDRVSFSRRPDRWRVDRLMSAAAALALPMLAFSFTLFFLARRFLRLPLAQMQTLTFVMLAFSGQGMVYLVRERRNFWRSRPSAWLLLSSAAGAAAAATLAVRGILMQAVPAALVGALLAAVLLFLLALDFAKVRVFRRFHLRD